MFIDVQDGRYLAHATAATCRESQNGNLMIVVKWELDDYQGSEFTSYSVIVKADGTVNERSIKTLREIFVDWDGTDPCWFIEAVESVQASRAYVTIAHEADREDPSKSWPRVKWIDPIKQEQTMEQATPSEMNSIRAKFGAKLRAVAAVSKVQKPAPKPAQKPAPKAPPAPPATAAVKKHDMNSAWEFCLSSHGGDVDAATRTWQATLEGRDVNACDWDEVAASFAAPLPF